MFPNKPQSCEPYDFPHPCQRIVLNETKWARKWFLIVPGQTTFIPHHFTQLIHIVDENLQLRSMCSAFPPPNDRMGKMMNLIVAKYSEDASLV